MTTALYVLAGVAVFLLLVTIYDVFQTKHAILRNFPIIGHFRYILESIGPELRQYIVTDNDEERPFTRDQRRWVYSSAKKQNNYFGFGTDNDLEQTPNYLIVRHSAFPLPEPHAGDPGYDPQYSLPCAKVIGGARERKHAFRPKSIVGVSAMSFGSLSARAVEAINKGCALADCLHNTGEGGISPYHLQGGGLIWQLGTGYFGARNDDGSFSLEKLVESCAAHPVRAVEIKLSQGAKPGLGGVLPAAKVTPEIARIRGIPVGKDCLSPSAHREFRDVDGLLDFAETIAEATGLPVGIKSAVGDMGFWQDLAAAHAKDSGRGLDYIQVDGGEGGTGAAPLAFCDHVALPFKLAFSNVYRIFAEQGVTDRIVFAGSGKLGFPETGLLAMAMGCDMLMLAREPMLAIGCIQAQNCHTGHCPAGVATQNKWLMRGLDPTNKAARLANYMVTLRKELTRLSRAAGVPHPALLTTEHMSVLDGYSVRSAREVFGYEEGWGRPSAAQLGALEELIGAPA
ncbi:MAG TPA: FMN-binding glutamate synthase family protein [Planctomycetes bacterium]|nr:FMN-binding glutamate synthase family protein [Planctomycetota bacterium]